MQSLAFTRRCEFQQPMPELISTTAMMDMGIAGQLPFPGLETEPETFLHPPPPLAEESNPAAATVMSEKEQGKGPEESAPHTTATAWDPNPQPPTGPTNPPALTTTEMAMEGTTQAPSPNTPLSPFGDATAASTTTAATGLPPAEIGTMASMGTAESEEVRNHGEANSSAMPPSEHVSNPPPLATTASTLPATSPTSTTLPATSTGTGTGTSTNPSGTTSISSSPLLQRQNVQSSNSSSNTGTGSGSSRLVIRRGSLPVHAYSAYRRTPVGGGGSPPSPRRTSPRAGGGTITGARAAAAAGEGSSKTGPTRSRTNGTVYESLKGLHQLGGPFPSSPSPVNSIPAVSSRMSPPFPPSRVLPLRSDAPVAAQPTTRESSHHGAAHQLHAYTETTGNSDPAALTMLTSPWTATVASSPSLLAPSTPIMDPASVSTHVDGVHIRQTVYTRHQSLPGGSLRWSPSPSATLGVSNNAPSGGAPSPTSPSFAGHRAHPYAGTEREREREREGGGARRRSITDSADRGTKSLASRRSTAPLSSASEAGGFFESFARVGCPLT